MALSTRLKYRISAAGCCGLLLFASARAEDISASRPGTDSSPGFKAGYSFGLDLAGLNERLQDVSLEDAIRGVCQALANKGSNVDNLKSCERFFATAVAEKPSGAQLVATTQGKRINDKGGNRALDDFAILNARREGVVVLPSSVQYEVLRQGAGRKTIEGGSVLVSYRASLPDGRVFDTTHEDGEPLRLALDEIAVPGLKEALSMMREGDQWRVVIPPRMGFGRSGNNRLRRHVLIYEIELLSAGITETTDSGQED